MTRAYVPMSIALIALAALMSIALYPGLPDPMPTHWDFHGQVNGYSSRPVGAFFCPVLMTGLVLLFLTLPRLSPKQFEVDSFRSTYLFLMLVLVALLAYLHALMLIAARSGHVDVSRAMIAGLFLFFAVVGNVLGKVKRNFWIGVRTPWTLADERVWADTHRFSARLFVVTGLLGFLLALTGLLSMGVAIAYSLTVALVPVLYSLVHYKKLHRGET